MFWPRKGNSRLAGPEWEFMDNLQGLFFIPPLETNAWGHIMEEIYKRGIYEPYRPQNKDGTVVIDCGANVGIASYYFSSRFEKVYSIEPSKEHFDVLTHMLKFNKIDNVKTFQFALSNSDGKENFYHYSNRTMYSLYPTAADGEVIGELRKTGMEQVELKRLDTFLKEQNIDKVDLLKMDVEGVEFEILCGDSFANVADKVKTVVCEIHSYSGRNLSQIYDALKELGYRVESIPHEANLIVATK